MPDIPTVLLEQGYATLDDCPDLSHESFREELKRQAEAWAARTSWDPHRSTFAMFLPPKEDHYTPPQRVALLLSYVNLRVRAANVRENDDQPLAVTGAGFAAAYPNVFPDLGRANQALRSLADIGFLRAQGDGFVEGPLLGHAFEASKVQELINGEMAGLFASLKPALPVGGELREQILSVLRALKGTKATKPVILSRMSLPWDDVKEGLDNLIAEGKAQQAGYAKGVHYILLEDQHV